MNVLTLRSRLGASKRGLTTWAAMAFVVGCLAAHHGAPTSHADMGGMHIDSGLVLCLAVIPLGAALLAGVNVGRLRPPRRHTPWLTRMRPIELPRLTVVRARAGPSPALLASVVIRR